MKVSFGYCEEVLKTLPVGYYLGHPVTVRLNPTGDQTYIELGSERITIGFANIYNACQSAPDNYDRETIIRSLFYHEISHAVMTPSDLMTALNDDGYRLRVASQFNFCSKKDPKTRKQVQNPYFIPAGTLDYIMKNLHRLVNIFEDERIETVLRNYYMNVDFKRLVVLLNGDPKNFDDQDPIGKFFTVVRYRQGDPKLVQQVQQIIKTWKDLGNKADVPTCCEYMWAIVWLMYQVMQTMPVQDAQDNEQPNKQQSEKQDKKTPGKTAQDNQSGQAPGEPAQDEQHEMTDEEIEQIMQTIEPFLKSFDDENDLGKVKTLFRKLTTNPKAVAIETKVNKILAAVLNKQKNQSSGSYGYAGRIDPRVAGSRNYRWFAKKNQGSAAKRFSKVRFNLFVDRSGSFVRSENAINALICALKKIESDNPDFSVRVVHCGSGTVITTQDDPYVVCDGCSRLDTDTKEKYNSLQMPNATNLNIVVFDGLMQDMEGSRNGKTYAAFNHPNCIIVSDDDNEDFINRYAPQSKSVIVSGDYAKVFTDIVLAQVEKLLA